MAETVSLEEQLPLLYALQEVDQEILALTDRRRSYVRRARALDAERKAEQATLDARQQEYTDVQVEHRAKNGELVALQEKLAGFEEKQQTARDAHEYVALGKQIETSTRIVGELEEATIELLLAVDEAKEALDAETERYQEVDRSFQVERNQIARAIKGLDSEIAERSEVRSKRESEVDRVLLRDYDNWRERSDQTMVAKVVTIETQERPGKNSPVTITYSCDGCHMTLPTQLTRQAATYEKRILCPACHRLLYVPQMEPEDPDDADQVSEDG